MSATEPSHAQSESASEAKLEFDVASVKQNKTDSNNERTANFPLGPGDVYGSVGGRFSAANHPLITYIAFAYKIVNTQVASFDSQLPSWARTDRFDIEANAQGKPTKDQMRLMMRALLADRFKLKVHVESHEQSVLALQLVKPGLTGPQLQPHPENSKCLQGC